MTQAKIKLSASGDARMIAQAANMSARPAHYSGRGATTSDLKGEQLRQIYESILKHHGFYAPQQFIKMVLGTPVLSATDFLLNLYRLEGNDWIWDDSMHTDTKGNYATDEMSGFATIIGALSGDNRRNQTAAILSQFRQAMARVKADKDHQQMLTPEKKDSEYSYNHNRYDP